MNDELRTRILAELKRQQRPARNAAPLAPGMKPEDSEEARDIATEIYGQSLLDRTGPLTQEEIQFLKGSLSAYQQSQEQ